jgi:selenide, water dikinase
MRKLVLVGGGHSHAIAILSFIDNPLIDTQITLVTDVLQTPYSGMLPGHIAGFYSFQECHIDLCKLAAAANIDIVVAKVQKLDVGNQQVICDNSQVITYDILSINIGSTPYIHGITGAENHGTPVKPIPAFLTTWQQLVREWEDCQSRQEALTITIVGGGAGGVELALNMQQRLANIYWQHWRLSQPEKPLKAKQFKLDKVLDKLCNKLKINLLHRQLDLLPQSHPWVGKYLRKLLSDRHIQLYLKESVSGITPQGSDGYNLDCASGLQISSDQVFWVTNAAAPAWLKSSGLATNETGFIAVNNYLQSISHPQIFAAGDIASMVNYQLPKAGVFAVRQGLPLAQNLRLSSQGQTLKPYQPQSRYLSLIGTGDRRALAIYGKFAIAGIAGGCLWHWKDRIDRQFMAQFKS